MHVKDTCTKNGISLIKLYIENKICLKFYDLNTHPRVIDYALLTFPKCDYKIVYKRVVHGPGSLFQ